MATTLKNFMAARSGEWQGLMSALYATLSEGISIDARRSGDWPGNARWFSDRLRRAGPALRALGIDVQEKRDGRWGPRKHQENSVISYTSYTGKRSAAPSG